MGIERDDQLLASRQTGLVSGYRVNQELESCMRIHRGELRNES